MYKESGYWERCDVPSYVWGDASLESAKILACDDHHQPDGYHLRHASAEVQRYFKFKGPCSNCGEDIYDDDLNLECATCAKIDGETNIMCEHCICTECKNCLHGHHCECREDESDETLSE